MPFYQLVRKFGYTLLLLCSLPVVAQAQTDLSGLWTGRSSGNQVTIETRPGGFAIIVAGQRREGQYGDEQFFREADSGLYLYTKPDGSSVRAQVLGPDTLQVTNPDGWMDVFTRPRGAVASSPPVVEETPLGLRNANPAQTGALAPQTEERYWVRGSVVLTDATRAECRDDCASYDLFFWVRTNDIPSSLPVIASTPFSWKTEGNEFGFGTHLLADTYWEIENPLESVSKFMTCNAKPSSGTVPANERAINIAFATFVTKLSCQLTEDGRIEMLRRRKDRESRKVDFIGVPIPYTSDALLKAQSAVRDILAKAKAGAGALPTTPLDSGLSAQTDSAINAGRAASDGEIAAGNSQVLQTAQSIAQQSFEQRARERQAATTGSGNYPAPFPAPLNGFAQPYSGAVGGGSSQPSQPVKEAVSEAHNPANEASSCITPIYKPSFAANRVSSIMGAVFRNSCGYSVEVTWCVTGADCNPGYSNVGTVMGNSDRGISFDASRPGSINYAACRIGFTRAQGALSPTFQHACK